MFAAYIHSQILVFVFIIFSTGMANSRATSALVERAKRNIFTHNNKHNTRGAQHYVASWCYVMRAKFLRLSSVALQLILTASNVRSEVSNELLFACFAIISNRIAEERNLIVYVCAQSGFAVVERYATFVVVSSGTGRILVVGSKKLEYSIFKGLA